MQVRPAAKKDARIDGLIAPPHAGTRSKPAVRPAPTSERSIEIPQSVIQSEPDHVLVQIEADRILVEGAAGEVSLPTGDVACKAAAVDVEIFELGAPAIPQQVFDTD